MAAGAAARQPRPYAHQQPGSNQQFARKAAARLRNVSVQRIEQCRAADQTSEEQRAPERFAPGGWQQAAEDAADAGDSAIEPQQQGRRDPDQQSANQRTDRRKGRHVSELPAVSDTEDVLRQEYISVAPGKIRRNGIPALHGLFDRIRIGETQLAATPDFPGRADRDVVLDHSRGQNIEKGLVLRNCLSRVAVADTQGPSRIEVVQGAELEYRDIAPAKSRTIGRSQRITDKQVRERIGDRAYGAILNSLRIRGQREIRHDPIAQTDRVGLRNIETAAIGKQAPIVIKFAGITQQSRI